MHALNCEILLIPVTIENGHTFCSFFYMYENAFRDDECLFSDNPVAISEEICKEETLKGNQHDSSSDAFSEDQQYTPTCSIQIHATSLGDPVKCLVNEKIHYLVILDLPTLVRTHDKNCGY